MTEPKGGKSGGDRKGEPKLTAPAKPAAPRKGAGAVSPKQDAPSASRYVAKPRKKKRKKSVEAATHTPWYWRRKVWLIIGTLIFMLAFMVIAAVVYYAQSLPSIAGLDTIKKQPGITMKTGDGLILASYGEVYGDYIEYQDLPKDLVHAVLATEDRRFFSHSGIDLMGIIRAMFVNMRAGRFVQGGSTITQQVAKNVFLTPERTMDRKIQEMMLAFWLEGRFTKEQILSIYLNRVYLGAGNYGVDAASRRYFSKSARDLNLMESAVLAGMLKAPSRYSPIASLEKARKRGHQVLLNMVDADYITEKDVKQALSTFKAPKAYRDGDASGTRYFTDWIMDQLPLYVGNIEQDLVVITTLDPALQKEAEDAVNKILDAEGAEKQTSQASLLAMTPNGAIKAMVGGKNYRESQFNRVVQANRQAGSVFKLFVYLAALDAGISPDAVLNDAPVEFMVGNTLWKPGNYDQKFRGPLSLRDALTQSVNTIAVQLSMAVGVQNVAEMAKRLGIAGVRANPSIALGALEANLLELTTAYAHLPNGGRKVAAHGIASIYSQSGDVLYETKADGLYVVLRDRVVQQMNYMLMNVPIAGTGRRAYIGRPMAGKTGTSSDFKDAWFIGFTPQMVTGVWVGNDDNTVMKKVTGGSLPSGIWHDFMMKVMENLPAEPLAANPYAVDESALPWQNPDDMPLDENGQPAAQTLDGLLQKLHEENGMTTEPAPAQEEQPSAPAATDQAPSDKGPALEGGFWNKLFEAAPETEEMEYEYPNSSERDRRLNR